MFEHMCKIVLFSICKCLLMTINSDRNTKRQTINILLLNLLHWMGLTNYSMTDFRLNVSKKMMRCYLTLHQAVCFHSFCNLFLILPFNGMHFEILTNLLSKKEVKHQMFRLSN